VFFADLATLLEIFAGEGLLSKGKGATIISMNPPAGPILAVEDIPNILELLEVTLRFKGYQVISACNGQEALEVIAREHPVLVITDILMPKMDGYALAQSLRTNLQTRQIPLIFLSATYVTPEDRAFAMSLGAKRFIEKPVDTEEFLLTVAEILTAGPASSPAPMDEQAFYRGYRERLEGKVRHKNVQIARTERLLQTLPPDQKQAFEALLKDARSQKEEIQKELDELYQLLNEPGRPTPGKGDSPALT
jgi:CheY-like chemotaxis protein